MYSIQRVDVTDANNRRIIDELNDYEDNDFPRITKNEYAKGYWWMAYRFGIVAGVAGLTSFKGRKNIGYLKRVIVLPSHRGHGLQKRFIWVREKQARKLGWKTMITDTTNTTYSANNLRSCGYKLYEPDRPWGFETTLYWIKEL